MPAAYPIFISYRRSDLSLEAEWLYNLIQTFFGDEAAFFDKGEIAGGTRWDDTLRTCVGSARLVLILIGPAWLKEQAASGMRRLDEPDDWVRHEVVAAIAAYQRQPGRTRVYPVLVNGAKLPRREWLPEATADLASFQLEPALQFHIKDYLDQAALIHEFLKQQQLALQRAGLVESLAIRPFSRERVPNPYDIPGYQLPEALRLRRPEHPFRGLDYFRKDDAPIFFGRNKEIGEIIDCFKKGRHFIRLFGQSGVGKSSLLFAGLLPRLEGNGWRLKYFRRDAGVSLARSLDALARELEADDGAESLIILDQVEEVITNPNPAAPNELEDLADAASRLAALNAGRRLPIRMMWAYRKEHDANVKAALRDKDLYSTEYWLKDLDRNGMREAIVGITRDRDLQAEYRIELETGIEEAILADLFDRGQRENATPLLQVLLRKMWDRVSASTAGARTFTREVYEACKCGDLVHLLQERLHAIASRPGADDLRHAVESGLALDLLKRLVTDQDTSLSVPEAELTDAYANAPALKRLLQSLVDRYLLVREEGPRYRLSHDTLARAVRMQCARSLLPAQRAARLLESKASDMETQPEAVDFSRADLRALDEGLAGMRRLSPNEQKAVEASRRKRRQEEQDLEEKNLQLQQALASEQQQSLQARSSFLNLQASQEADLTTAIRLCLEAVKLFPSPAALRNLYRCHDAAYAADPSTPLRSTLARGAGRAADLLAGEAGLLFSGGDRNEMLCLYDFDTGASRWLPHTGNQIAAIRCSPFGPRAFVSRADQTAAVIELEQDAARPLPAPFEFEQVAFFDADRLIYHHRSRVSLFDIATCRSAVLLQMPEDELIFTFTVAPDAKRILLATRAKRLYEYTIDGGELRLLVEYDEIISHVHYLGATEVVLADLRRGVITADLGTGKTATLQGRNNEQFMQGTFLSAGNSQAIGYTRSDDADKIVVQFSSGAFSLRCQAGDYFDGLVLAPGRQLAITTGFRGVVLWRLHKSAATVLRAGSDARFVKADAAPGKYLLGYADKLTWLNQDTGEYGDLPFAGLKPEERTAALAADLVAFAGEGRSFILADLRQKLAETVSLNFAAEPFGVYVGAGRVWLTDDQGGLHVYRPGERQWRHHAFGQLVYELAFGPDDRLAIGLKDGSVQIARVNEPAQPLFRFHKLSKPLLCLDWSSDGRFLFAGGWNSFGVLADLHARSFLKLQHNHWVTGAAFSPDGSLLATTSPDGQVRLFDTAGGQPLRGLTPGANPGACRFTADGRHLLVVLDGSKTVLQWTLATVAEIESRLNEFAIDPLAAPPDAASAASAAATSEDPDDPFSEDLPPQVNLGGLSIEYHEE